LKKTRFAASQPEFKKKTLEIETIRERFAATVLTVKPLRRNGDVHFEWKCPNTMQMSIFHGNDHLQWKEAIPHLGCAFEAAEILLSHNAIDTEVSCDWLAKSALLLAQNFNKLDYQSQAEDIIWMAINRLEEQLALDRTQGIWMEHYLTALYAKLKVYIIKVAKAHGPKVNSQKVVSLMH
jgi:hypothetical protein